MLLIMAVKRRLTSEASEREPQSVQEEHIRAATWRHTHPQQYAKGVPYCSGQTGGRHQGGCGIRTTSSSTIVTAE